MIPVIGAAIVNEVKWLKRQLDSVDFPVENYIIIDNSGGVLNEELNNLISNTTNEFIKNLKVYHMPYNIGCGAAWNMIINSFMKSKYWVLASHDCSFGTGFLKEMHDKAQDNEVGMIHGNGGEFGLGSYDLFLIKSCVVQSHGYFDENLYPAYGEDVDYIMRLHNKPIKKAIDLKSIYYHGDAEINGPNGADNDYEETGMKTKKHSQELHDKLTYINELNYEYLFKKWGPHWRTVCPYEYPFNIEGLDIRASIVDLEFCKGKHLGF